MTNICEQYPLNSRNFYGKIKGKLKYKTSPVLSLPYFPTSLLPSYSKLINK